MNPKALPTRKVGIGAAVGGVSAITVWALSEYAGIVIPGDVAIAGQTVALFIIQYFVSD